VPENEHPVPTFAAAELVNSSWRSCSLGSSAETVGSFNGVSAAFDAGANFQINFFPDFMQVNFFPLLVAL
jgi:hypothetical protein